MRRILISVAVSLVLIACAVTAVLRAGWSDGSEAEAVARETKVPSVKVRELKHVTLDDTLLLAGGAKVGVATIDVVVVAVADAPTVAFRAPTPIGGGDGGGGAVAADDDDVDAGGFEVGHSVTADAHGDVAVLTVTIDVVSGGGGAGGGGVIIEELLLHQVQGGNGLLMGAQLPSGALYGTQGGGDLNCMGPKVAVI